MNVFFFHYNKPASQKSGSNKISVHFKKKCYIVDNVVVKVPTFGHSNKTQPRFVMKGKCNNVTVDDNNIALIN